MMRNQSSISGILLRLHSRRRNYYHVSPSLSSWGGSSLYNAIRPSLWSHLITSYNNYNGTTSNYFAHDYYYFSSSSSNSSVSVSQSQQSKPKEVNGNDDGTSSSRNRKSRLDNDGLTLSDFIAAASSSSSVCSAATNPNSTVQEVIQQSATTAVDDNNNIPMPVELGDEFDELDVMVTDALSSSISTAPSPSSSSSSSIDRLGHQMINSTDDDEEEEELTNNSNNNNNNNNNFHSNNNNNNNNNFHTLKFHLKTYGCQMNVSDTDIVRSILLNNHLLIDDDNDSSTNNNDGDTTTPSTSSSSSTSVGIPPHTNNLITRFIETTNEIQADILLTNTCAIRENAEQKVWHRLRTLRSHDRNYPLMMMKSSVENDNTNNSASTMLEEEVEDLTKLSKEQRKQQHQHQQQQQHYNNNKKKKQKRKKRIIGVLGCMAERLKEDMFKHGTADVVVGPDAYRDLPRLLSVLSAPSSIDVGSNNNNNIIPTERAVNVQLSLDETYASITPVRSNPQDISAFVSVMRGCNNMCSYCVVPFTRGRERSRDMNSIVEETRRLVEEEGIKEVILLGQNVNSYHVREDGKKKKKKKGRGDDDDSSSDDTYQTSNDGFSNMFRLRHGDGYRFANLLEAVSNISPELRVRFTSPHPKDYPPSLLSLMSERANICNHLHMPAQSGSSLVLERMRRGYTREAYLELINDVRSLIPDVAISSDFITGFCGETEEEHNETLSLMNEVQFDQAFMFTYSMRGKTHAHRTMEDDVSPDVKNRRLNEIIDTFRRNVQIRNTDLEIGMLRLVLVEGESKKSTLENKQLSGRTDQNKRVVFSSDLCLMEEDVNPYFNGVAAPMEQLSLLEGLSARPRVGLQRGDYAVVQITDVRGHTLKGKPLWRSSIRGFEQLRNAQGWHDFRSSGLVDKISV